MTPTKLSDAGLDLIKEFEGYHRSLPDGRCIAYKCPAGVWTLGWGATLGIKPGMIWTRDEAEAALHRELATFEAGVLRLVTVQLNQNEYDALVSFSYNCGLGALGKSTILRKLNANDRIGAADAFGMWTRGGGRVLPGLVRRRKAEAALFLQPVPAEPTVDDEPAQPDMPQSVEAVREPPKPGAVAAGAAAGGTAIGTVVNSIPAAPDLSAAVGWQGFAQTLSGLSGFVSARPLLVLAVLAVVAGVWLLPKWGKA
jgi:lysozyme